MLFMIILATIFPRSSCICHAIALRQGMIPDSFFSIFKESV